MVLEDKGLVVNVLGGKQPVALLPRGSNLRATGKHRRHEGMARNVMLDVMMVRNVTLGARVRKALVENERLTSTFRQARLWKQRFLQSSLCSEHVELEHSWRMARL